MCRRHRHRTGTRPGGSPHADRPSRRGPGRSQTRVGGRVALDDGRRRRDRPPPDEQRVPGESIADGVFVVVSATDASTREFLAGKNQSGAYVSEDGVCLAFFRPHHWPGSETPVSVAQAGTGGHTGVPGAHVADVTATATATPEPGTVVEIDNPHADAPIAAELEPADAATAGGHVPFVLLDGAEVTTAVEAGQPVTAEDVTVPESFLKTLREGLDGV